MEEKLEFFQWIASVLLITALIRFCLVDGIKKVSKLNFASVLRMPHFNSNHGFLSQVRILIRKFWRRFGNPPSFGVLKERKSNVLLGSANALLLSLWLTSFTRAFSGFWLRMEKNRSEGLKWCRLLYKVGKQRSALSSTSASQFLFTRESISGTRPAFWTDSCKCESLKHAPEWHRYSYYSDFYWTRLFYSSHFHHVGEVPSPMSFAPRRDNYSCSGKREQMSAMVPRVGRRTHPQTFPVTQRERPRYTQLTGVVEAEPADS